ncbi:MAG: glycogen synthase [Bacteroidota bacterium]
MNILLASAEVAPFAKAGGLADIAANLPIEWQKFGQNVIIVMPKYLHIDTYKYGFQPTHIVLYVPMGGWTEYGHLWYGTLPDTQVPVYLIENLDYFNRHGIYGDPNEYSDNDRRFIFFSRAIFETANALNFTPDIIHAHDFHTAFSMAFLKSDYRYHYRFSRTAGVYTIHNLAYQGWFNPKRAMQFSGFGMKEFYPGSWFEQKGAVNAMKTGIMFADKITTVSPTYAREIRHSYFSEGMQDVLNIRASDLVGILNGVNYSEWDPEKDNLLYSKYNKDYLQGKKDNKINFLQELGLDDKNNLDLPLVGMVSRLTEQKGIDLMMNKWEYFLDNNKFRFALLGSGDTKYEDYFRYLSWKYPEKVFTNIGYNETLSHRLIAGCDFLVLPSRFEPCGLTQMYALKYGTIPIVRNTGGLADTVTEFIPATGNGDGFVFNNYNAEDFAFAINRALDTYHNAKDWDTVRTNAMSSEFSSGNAALEYLKVFKWALEKIRSPF